LHSYQGKPFPGGPRVVEEVVVVEEEEEEEAFVGDNTTNNTSTITGNNNNNNSSNSNSNTNTKSNTNSNSNSSTTITEPNTGDNLLVKCWAPRDMETLSEFYDCGDQAGTGTCYKLEDPKKDLEQTNRANNGWMIGACVGLGIGAVLLIVFGLYYRGLCSLWKELVQS